MSLVISSHFMLLSNNYSPYNNIEKILSLLFFQIIFYQDYFG